MKRLYYSTHYDDTDTICGYVIPLRETIDCIYINKRQYRRALSHRTVGGIAGIKWHTHKHVMIIEEW